MVFNMKRCSSLRILVCYVCAQSLQAYPTLCDPVDCNITQYFPSVHRTSKTRILEWVAMPSSRRSSWPRDRTHTSCIAGRFFILWATQIKTTVRYHFTPVRKCSAHSTALCYVSSVMSDSLWPHGLEPARLLWPWNSPRQEYWSGLPFPTPGDVPSRGIKPGFLMSSALAGGFFTTSTTWEVLPVRMAIIKKKKNLQTINAGEDVEKGNPLALLVRI